MSSRRQLAPLVRWIPWIVVAIAVSTAGAFFLSSMQPKVFEATTTLVVGQSLTGPNPDYNQLLVSQRLSATYARIAKTEDILETVIEDLKLPTTVDELASRVVATGDEETLLLSIACQASSGSEAAATCDGIANELIKLAPGAGDLPIGQAEIAQDLADIRSEILAAHGAIEELLSIDDRTNAQEVSLQRLQDRNVSLRATYATLVGLSSNQSSNLLTVVQSAIESETPIAPRPVTTAILAGMVTFLVVCAIAFVLNRLDERIRDPEGAQEALGLPTLGTVGTIRGVKDRSTMYRLAAMLYPRSSAAEAYRTLRTNVEFASVDHPIKSLLVTSARTGDGKTITAANLAIVFAQAGHRVLLVDADLRRPSVDTLLQVPNSVGLTTLLRGTSAHPDLLAVSTDQENLWVLPSGPLPANPAEILGSKRMASLVDLFTLSYDLTIFDSPPIQGLADALVLSAVMDGTVLVIDAGRTDRTSARHAAEALAKASANVLGVVINRISAQEFGGYDTYYGPDPDATAKAATETRQST